jgi:hypothetical protein
MSDIYSRDFEESLSLERFGRYLAWAAGDRERAIDLYTLNAQISECLYTPLHMLEVALRNRIHTVLAAAAHDRWFDDPEFQKGNRQAEQLAKAKVELAEDGKDLSPGRVVAALTFGYWTAFFGPGYEDTWRKGLHAIARDSNGKSLRRKDFSAPLTPIRVLRNRIAHHEPILSWNLPKHHENIVLLTEWLSPPAALWCRTHSRFPAVHPAERIVLAKIDIAASPETVES